MIRRAKAIDIPAIVQFLLDEYRTTHYAQTGSASVDVVFTKHLLLKAIHRHGHQSENATWVEVAERNGIITGLMLATLQRVYAIGDRLMASDLFYVVNGLASPTDAALLALRMIEWAKASPWCIEVKCGSTAIKGDAERGGKMLQRLGLKPYGSLFRLEFDRTAEGIAA